MPEPTVLYKCSICDKVYKNFDKALECESKGYMEDIEKLPIYEIGDRIEFIDEQFVEIGFSYIKRKGIISYRYAFLRGDNVHQYVYLIDTPYNEVIAFWLCNDGEWGIYSTVECKQVNQEKLN